jgi:uncharacterized membrane protein
MQSIIFGGVWLLFWIVWKVLWALLIPIPIVGWVFSIPLLITWVLINIAFLVLMIVAIIKAFTGVRWDIPYIGPIARKQVEGAA